MYWAVAGACAEQEANASQPYTLSALSFDSSAYADTAPNVEIMTSPTEVILTALDGSSEELRSYTFDDSSLPSFASVNDTITTTGDRPRGNAFGDDGQYLYVVGQPLSNFAANPPLLRYTLSPDYDLGTSSPTTQQRNSGLGAAQGVAVKSDGTKLFIITSTNVTILTLSTAYTISSGVSSSSATLGGTDDDGDTITGYTGIRFNPDGTKVFVAYRVNNTPKVAEYALSTAWDLTTKTFTSSLNIGANLGLHQPSGSMDPPINAYIAGLDWNSDGTRLLVASIHGDFNDNPIDYNARRTVVAMYS